MRILILTPTFFPDVGGVETMLTNFSQYLAKLEYHVDIITYSPLIAPVKAPRKERIGEFITVRRIPWIGYGLFNIFEHYPLIQFFYLVPALVIATILFILTKTNEDRPDILHVFGLSGVFAGGVASRIFNIPCVADMCTVYRFPQRPCLAAIARIMLDLCDYIRGNNLNGQAELLKVGLNVNKVGIITPPVDENIFKPYPASLARKKLSLPGDKFIALFVGRMVNGKGVELAVEATRFIPNQDMVFVFVGEGPLQQLVKDASLADKRIIIADTVAHHKLVDYYNAADILLCAPVDKDLLAFVGREALMCGLPILAPNIATYFGISCKISKDLIPTKVGRVFEANPTELAGQLNELVATRNTDLYPFSRELCLEYGVSNFSAKALDWIRDSYDKAKQNHFPGHAG
jgi:glycosyltransferase involved in cell wall biosynthesis